jgi:hypothetical protein
VKSLERNVSVYGQSDNSVRARKPEFGLIVIRIVIMVYGCECGLEL